MTAMRKRIGPSTKPCGTLIFNVTTFDFEFPFATVVLYMCKEVVDPPKQVSSYLQQS
jgi:hypothetical protein